MIRRLADGDVRAETSGWLLIGQIEHARISAEMAANLTSQAPLDALVTEIIRHHDDGWRAWDEEPAFDHANGRPYDFREMPSRSKNQIWSRSIEEAARFGPLAQYLVARHFLRLRRTAEGPRSTAAHQEFALRFESQSERWLADWQAMDAANTERAAACQLAKLRWLDDWSLWLCCAERQRPWQTTDDQGRPTHLVPDVAPRVFRVQPWPFAVDELRLQASTRFLPADQYPDAALMRDSLVDSVSLSWLLKP